MVPENQPKHPKGGEYLCTKEMPHKAVYKGNDRWVHEDAVCIDSHDRFSALDDNYDVYECPNCGIRFKVTLPSH